MQEINELKNLVIQSLEGNGVLSQIRAQIRASIFKTIEMQETSAKKNAGFYWENPLCQTIYDNKEGKIALEIINEFLEFFKMDYTLSVFTHEANLKDPARKDELQKKLGLKGDGNRPVLFQLIKSLMPDGSPSKENQPAGRDNDPFKNNNTNALNAAAAAAANKNKPGAAKNITTDFQEADLGKKNFDNFGKNKKPGFPSFDEPQEDKAADLARKGGKLAPLTGLSPQDKFGGNKLQTTDLLSGDPKKPAENKPAQQGDFKKPGGGYYNTGGDKYKAQQESEEDDYGEEVFENVDEELVEDLEEEEDTKNRDKKSMLTSSEDIIGASQSQGFDVSVDSLALEEYDYYENAQKPR